MQIMINISKDDYRKVQDGRASVSMMRKAIRNGKTLPKGHGRLIDADALSKDCESSEYHEVITSWLDLAQTIIEADKESEEKNEHTGSN